MPDFTSVMAARDDALHQAGLDLRMASIRPICVVTWMTRSFGATSIIDTSSVPVRCASSSVWPGYLCPAACSASLESGAVQMASHRPW
jgi:hypothetical protein